MGLNRAPDKLLEPQGDTGDTENRDRRETYRVQRQDDDSPPKDTLSGSVLEAAIAVHRAVGPGLLESVYEACLCYELSKRGIPFARSLKLPIIYDGRDAGVHFRLDLLVESQLVVELKSVETLLPVHLAQLITYLRLGGFRRGLSTSMCGV